VGNFDQVSNHDGVSITHRFRRWPVVLNLDDMFILILILIIGSVLVYISDFNFMLVSVNFGYFILSDIPLFYVIVGSIVFGLLLSYIVYLINSISTSFALRGKDKVIKKNKNEVLELTKRIHQLELEIEQQKKSASIEPSDENAL